MLFPPSALQSTVDPMVDVAVSSSSSTSYSAANVAAAAAAAAAVRSAHNFNKVGPCDLQAASKKIWYVHIIIRCAAESNQDR